MNLDEFKKQWNNSLSANKNFSRRGNELDVIFHSAFERVNQLAKTTKFWWTVSAMGIGLVFILLLVMALLYMWNPELLDSLKNAVPVLVLLPVFVTAVGFLYYRQARIFDVYNCNTLSNALQQSIIRFRNWYQLSVVTFAILLVPVYFLLLTGISYRFDVALSQNIIFAIAASLTILTLVLNHLHYKRTYFHWINQLKNSIDELGR